MRKESKRQTWSYHGNHLPCDPSSFLLCELNTGTAGLIKQIKVVNLLQDCRLAWGRGTRQYIQNV